MSNQITWNKFTSFDELPEPKLNRSNHLIIKYFITDFPKLFTAKVRTYAYDNNVVWLDRNGDMVEECYYTPRGQWALINGPEETE